MGRKKIHEDTKAKHRAYYQRHKEVLKEKKRAERKIKNNKFKRLQRALQQKEKELMEERLKRLNANGALDRAEEKAKEDEPIRESTTLTEGEKLITPELKQRRGSRRVSRKPLPFHFEYQYSN